MVDNAMPMVDEVDSYPHGIPMVDEDDSGIPMVDEVDMVDAMDDSGIPMVDDGRQWYSHRTELGATKNVFRREFMHDLRRLAARGLIRYF